MERINYILTTEDVWLPEGDSLENAVPLASSSDDFGAPTALDNLGPSLLQEGLAEAMFGTSWDDLHLPRSSRTPDKLEAFCGNGNSLLAPRPSRYRILSFTEAQTRSASIADCFGNSLHVLRVANHFTAPPVRPRRFKPICAGSLDAVDVVGDYYLNLMAWNSDDVLAVALGLDVFLYDTKTQVVTKVCLPIVNHTLRCF